MLVIRKYPNRRLYDTSKSCYVTLEDLKQLVLDHVDFQVVDSKTDADLTQQVLLQIIAELEGQNGQSLLTTNVLRQLIRFYGSNMHGVFRVYIDQSVSAFLEQQEAFQAAMRTMMDKMPLSLVSKLIEGNIEFWRQVATGFQRGERQERQDKPDKLDGEP